MKVAYALLGYSDLIQKTDAYLKRNFLTIFILGLLAGTGRFIQEGGNGEISSSIHGVLEVVVNGARLLIIFAIIGLGSMLAGFRSFINIFRLTRTGWHIVWNNIKDNFSDNFLAILVNFIVFIIVSVIVNLIIFASLEYTPFLEWLKSNNLISPTASKWPVLLFLKNISIIPFTLVFETLFVMWIVERNKLITQ